MEHARALRFCARVRAHSRGGSIGCSAEFMSVRTTRTPVDAGREVTGESSY